MFVCNREQHAWLSRQSGLLLEINNTHQGCIEIIAGIRRQVRVTETYSRAETTERVAVAGHGEEATADDGGKVGRHGLADPADKAKWRYTCKCSRSGPDARDFKFAHRGTASTMGHEAWWRAASGQEDRMNGVMEYDGE
ncbi:hypothetical protein C8J57DRAFT_1238214 [Mycena rebaudengoi]|nr:hypothetical protein C8J57DRAFT_1238214 [Mycena rebaudengoi]